MRRLLASKRLNARGFTLVELAVVLIIIALISAMGLVATLGAIDSARRASTENRLDAVEKALMNFRLQNDRLPCPGDPTMLSSNASYGVELVEANYDCTSNNSGANTPPYLMTNLDLTQVVEGGVPTRTLGLPDEFMFDGWGRRIMYAIAKDVAKPNAFNLIQPQVQDCVVSIVDPGGTRTGGAVYALISYGKNGHGAFTNGSTRLNAGVTNAHERANCHCNSSGVYVAPNRIKYMLKEYLDSTSNALVFDDIVRYKERWQMQNERDYKYNTKYKDIQLVINYATTGDYWLYKYTCVGWAAASPTNYNINSGNGSLQCAQSAYTADNNTLLTQCNDADYGCMPITTLGGTFENADCTNPNLSECVPTCPQWGALPLTMSNNDYVALGVMASPYVQMYRATKTDTSKPYFSPLATSQASAVPAAYTTLPTLGLQYGQPTTVFPTTGDLPGAIPTLIVLSKNAELMFVSDQTTYAYMYGRVGDSTYKKLYDKSTNQVVGTACERISGEAGDCTDLKSAAFSQDGRYFAVGYRHSSMTGAVKIWKLSTGGTLFSSASAGAFVSVAAIDTVMDSIAFGDSTGSPTVAFSPDGQYFAAASGQSSGGSVASNQCLLLYHILEGDVFTDITANILGDYYDKVTPMVNPPMIFTGDSNQILLPVQDISGEYDIITLKRLTSDVFEVQTYYTGVSPFHSLADPKSLTVLH